MARPNRLILPDVPVHIIQRGHNRAPCFFSTRDFESYRDVLLETSQRYHCAIHAYVLMTNHVHLLVTAVDPIVASRMMQAIGLRYVQRVNLHQQRKGTLWEGRFKSSVIHSERYFLTCSRYIELNPVRAGMVEHAGDYRWSSYRHNAHGEHDPLVTSYSLYDALASTPQLRRTAYRELFRQAIEPQSLESIRKAGNRGAVLGDVLFAERLEASVRRRVVRLTHGGDRKSSIFKTIGQFTFGG